jgi:hypothetical protein
MHDYDHAYGYIVRILYPRQQNKPKNGFCITNQQWMIVSSLLAYSRGSDKDACLKTGTLVLMKNY